MNKMTMIERYRETCDEYIKIQRLVFKYWDDEELMVYHGDNTTKFFFATAFLDWLSSHGINYFIYYDVLSNKIIISINLTKDD